jgi:hypothetical protein
VSRNTPTNLGRYLPDANEAEKIHETVIVIVTDLINALPGNSTVNTVQHTTIEEAVFTVSDVTSRSGGRWSRDMCFL